jgi:hypothetical protein
MKKYARIIGLASHIGVVIIVNLILFLCVRSYRLGSPTFWTAWAFSTVVNTGFAVALFFFTRKKFKEWLTLPILYYFSFIISAVFLVVGLIFMVLPIESLTAVWVVNVILTIISAILMLYIIFGIKYIGDNTQKVKEKVSYIRELQFIADDCMNLSKNAEVTNQLRKLSESIRFSDPMSNEKTAAYEKELQDLLLDIQVELGNNPEADVKEAVTKAQQILARRNSLVRISK